ncbi:putative eka-like protein [Erysiphe necator]|uniref:Putative eka-like protein n=1 Tax=Uncinula necator TaxID=52586 RepID=A0A0B1P4T8_UNCNE|nr:putative eka-like protein [Erysiphe necator]
MHEWRKLSPAAIREMIVKRLHVSPASIGLIKPVRSGFALSPCSSEAREELLKVSGGLFLSGAKLEPANQWVPLLIPTVPRSINTLQGHMEVTKEMLSDEIERASSVRPEALKLYGNHKPDAPHRTWLALFTKPPKPGFGVFDESGITHALKKQIAIDFCKRRNGHHSSKFCSRAPSCGNYGSNMHTQDNFKATTRCRNCGGPHRSDSRRCLARPTCHGAPTKEQLRAYRQAGDREFQATIRARVVEEKASAMEVVIGTPEVTVVAPEKRETSPPIPGSLDQVELTEIIIDNTQQESVGSSADSNMDL